MTRDKWRLCVACGKSEQGCWALARHSGHPCCTTCNHEPPEETT